MGYKSIRYFPSLIVKKPCIPESDIAGTVVALGSDVQEWKAGDEVFGIIPGNEVFKTGQGGLTEYAAVDQNHMYSIVFQLYD